MHQTIGQLKHKLRQLKKLEVKVRFGGGPVPENSGLVWDTFFSTKTESDRGVQYSLNRLLRMDRESPKAAFAAFFYGVYFQYYRESGLVPQDLHDPRLLSLLDLPPDAGIQDIKNRFRQLAKEHHPDHGGDSRRFIELIDTYEKLKGV